MSPIGLTSSPLIPLQSTPVAPITTLEHPPMSPIGPQVRSKANGIQVTDTYQIDCRRHLIGVCGLATR
jgi:hypothetical protein